MRQTLSKIVPAIFLSPFYAILAVFVYYAVLSQFPAAEAKLIDWKPKTLSAGDEITITYDVKHYRDCSYHTIRRMIKIEDGGLKGNIITVGYIERTIKAGEQEGPQEVIFPIPITTTSGTYDIYAEIQPVCNFYDYMIPKILPVIPLRITIDNNPADI